MILKSVKLKWCWVNKVKNTDSKKFDDCFCVDIYPSDSALAVLEDLDVKPKEDKDGQTFYFAKRNVIKGNGAEAGPPVVVDKYNKPFTAEIGNGTIANVSFFVYDYEGINYLYLKGVQVLDLVPYGTDGSEFTDESEDGSGNEFSGVNEEGDVPF